MESLARKVLNKIKEQGKVYFNVEENLGEIEELQKNPQHIQELIEGLNFVDNGLKQPCTSLAVILKIGKKHPHESIRILENALKNDEAPVHYLCELVYKIHRETERK